MCFRHSKEASGAGAGWAGKVDLADEVGEAGTQVAQAHGTLALPLGERGGPRRIEQQRGLVQGSF